MESTRKYSPQLIQKWSQFLRMVANKLNGPDNELANHFYNVHYAIGPKGMTESDIFALDEDYLKLVASRERSIRGLIKSLQIVIRMGDKLSPMLPVLMNQSILKFMYELVWALGLKDYLTDLLAHLTAQTQKS